MNLWITNISLTLVRLLPIIGFLHASIYDAPDYGLVTTDSNTRYLYVIAFVDRNTAKIYHNDPRTIKRAVATTFTTANTYFYQLDIRLILADVIITDQDFGQIQDTNKFHNELRSKRVLPYHNFAVFLASGKTYGTAWAAQLCRPYNGIIVPMSPYSPEESGPGIVEYFGILLNMSRTENPENLENCRCKAYFSRSRASGRSFHMSDKCLQAPGFSYNCTFQALYNKVKESNCIPKKKRTHNDDVAEGYANMQPSAQVRLHRINICGNGILEEGEQCDCGYRKSCKDHLERKSCDQNRCKWEGETSEEEISLEEICECTLERKILERHCGRRKCTLGIPIWIKHAIVYSITGMIFTLLCCCFSCIYGRNPSKIYRKSLIIEYGDRPKKSPPPPPPAYLKPKKTSISRPSTAPPPPPVKPKEIIVKLPTAQYSSMLAQTIPLPKKSSSIKENPYDKVPFN